MAFTSKFVGNVLRNAECVKSDMIYIFTYNDYYNDYNNKSHTMIYYSHTAQINTMALVLI